MAQQTDPRILGTKPIGKLLLRHSIPAITGMAITSFYNIIDSIFVGYGVDPMAISGLAITFPLMNLVIAFCVLISAGGSTISSIRLGQKDIKGATDALGNTLMLCLMNTVLFGGLAYPFLNPILFFFGASSGTLPYARDFMQVILLGTPITYTMTGPNNVMRATGCPRRAMLTSLVTVIANVIIAPIFIFHFGWEIRRAVMAIVLSRFIGMVWVVNHFRNKESFVHFMPGLWKMERRIIGSIFSIGMSPFAIDVTACIIVIFVDNSLQEYGGDTTIGTYGIINRLLMPYVMVVTGLTMRMQPIVGYNHGAQKIDRVKHTLRLGTIVGVLITSSGFVICELFPYTTSAIFTDSDELIDMTSSGLRICMLIFPFVGAQVVISNFFQSIGMVKISIFLSLSRQLVYLLPGLLLLPPSYSVKGVWISMPVSDGLAFITAVVILVVYIKKVKERASGQSL